MREGLQGVETLDEVKFLKEVLGVSSSSWMGRLETRCGGPDFPRNLSGDLKDPAVAIPKG